MSPLEIYHFLSAMIRESAGSIAALVVGLALGLYLSWWLFSRRAKVKIARLRMRIEVLEGVKDTLQKEIIHLKVVGETQAEERKQLAAERDAAVAEHTSQKEQIRTLQDKLVARAKDLERVRVAYQQLQEQWAEIQAKSAEHERQLRVLRQTVVEWEQKHDTVNTQCEKAEQDLAGSRRELSVSTARCNSLQERLQKLVKHYQNIVNQEGRVWEAPVTPTAPAFQPLAVRKVPIISILNLKGGVGKTTIALNLGAMLSNQGEKRVLLFDLDYQRSLSALCLPYGELKRLHAQKRCLQHFLTGRDRTFLEMLKCVSSMARVPGCSIVVNTDPVEGSDTLEDAEMQLMTQWLVQPGTADVRMHLRNALHSREIGEHFDYVLLDCPPRLSTACINALAASDFALIPVILDYTSAMVVPRLLQSLKRLKGRKVIPNLSILGILGNRTTYRGDELIQRERDVVKQLTIWCKGVWGEPVHFFPITIRQSASFGKASGNAFDESESTLAVFQDAQVDETFQQLVKQMKARIKHESDRLAAVPS